MIRFLMLAGFLMGLAGCSFAPTDQVLNALAQDHNSVSVNVTFTTPWGTEQIQVERNMACTAANPTGSASAVKP